MYDDIKKNKIKTGIIVSLFLAMIFIIVYVVCYIRGIDTYYAVFITSIFSVISTVITYYNCDRIVLASVGAKEASKEEYPQYHNIVDGLMVASGLESRPRLYVMDSMQPNAFASGRNPEHAVVCVTKGLLEKLDYYELEGVIAHEMSHIKNYDIMLSAVVSVMAGFVVMFADMSIRVLFRGRGGRSSRKDANPIEMILVLIGLVFIILAPLFSQLIQLAVSRRREYLADATAISFTRNPDGLISALIKISKDKTVMENASRSTEHMYFANPLKSQRITSLFSTHPSVRDRVEALKNLK
ncbi:MAG: M48 family metallopeptidase [Clostridia bacterium]|nr:M48 family metallopeptidase [Clostridia bacterium]